MSNNPENHFNRFLNESLNPEQKDVVNTKDGVMLVCAGAGSGKTRVITARIANLILNHDVWPSNILALTFTNKAANEMKERVRLFLSDRNDLPYVGTFHSYCYRLLKMNPHLMPFEQFSLMDDSDQLKLVRAIISKNGLTKKYTPKNVLSYISRIKNEALDDEERETLFGYDNILKELYYTYEQEKHKASCLDFDDLLLYTLDIFKKHEAFKNLHQLNIRHILIDEYQDTNKVQHNLLKAMSTKDNVFTLDSLCIVGDEDQSIYSWRGATIANMINFNKDFVDLKTVTIEQNYRSVQPILHVANEVIKNNTFRNPKKLWSDKSASDRIRVLTCSSNYQEGQAIANLTKILRAKHPGATCAILYRSHYLSRSIEEALIHQTIPYKIIGGVQFYDRQEVKDLIAYLRLVINPHDRLALSRVINTPGRGLGEKFEELLFETWDQQPFLDFKGVCKNLIDSGNLTSTKQKSLTHFVSIFENLDNNCYASDAIAQIIEKSEYYTYLRTAYEKEEADTRIENIKELINGTKHFEEKNQNAQGNIDSFLQEVSLLQDLTKAQEKETNHVYLMTLHAAKGLEFDTVILTGFEDGILPSTRSMYQDEALEEERRLLYVGITRARERLLITYTRYRHIHGQLTDQRPSRFMDELDENHIIKEDFSQRPYENLTSYFAQWLNPVIDFNIKADPTTGQKPKKPDTTSSIEITPSKSTKWRLQQAVTHGKFGTGIIQNIEGQEENTKLTIRFKSGIKKIISSFVS